jgi:translation initiation factor 3 subunit G
MTTPARRWGDDLDDSGDDEGLVIPPTHKSRVDKQGIQIVTSYRPNPLHPMKLLKTVQNVKITTERFREPVAVGERRKWAKFGQALQDDKDSNKTTVQSKEDIILEDPNADTDLQDEDPAQAIGGNLTAFWKRQKQRQLEAKFGVGGDDEPAVAAAAVGLAGAWTKVGVGGASAAGAGGVGGKYVPPSARASALAARMGGAVFVPERRTDDLNTIRVTNLSEKYHRSGFTRSLSTIRSHQSCLSRQG